MRIALLSTPFVAIPPHDYGGTELVVHELAEGLRARGHHVTVFATGDSSTTADLRALYATAQWPPNPMTDLNHVTWALSEVRRGDFDLVHAHSATALGGMRLLHRLPLVYTLHHERNEELSAFYRYFPDVQYIAISADQRDREVELSHVKVIYHGLDPSRFECVRQPADYVAFVGRFARVKGPHTAMDVAKAAGVPIRIAGEVHPVDAAFGAAEVLPRLTQPHVTYLNVIGIDVKRPLLRDARALLVPIEWNEPFGLIMIEAMLSGCPVVAFARGSVRELVEPGVTGFLARSAEEMTTLIRPAGPLDSFDRLACRARAIERFGSERMVRAHERLYQQVLAQTAPAAGPALIRPAIIHDTRNKKSLSR